MKSKKCCSCNEVKPVSAFTKDARVKSGRYSRCRQCHYLSYGHQNFDVFVTRMYDCMTRRVRTSASYRGRKVLFSRSEFLDWAFRVAKLRALFDLYQQSGRDPHICPTVDRIHGGDYELSNLQIITRKQNAAKYIQTGL